MGEQLYASRKRRRMTQPDIARRLGRDQARISGLERDMLDGRLGRDRLTLFAEMCDALDLVPVLVPRAKARAILAELAAQPGIRSDPSSPRSTYDEVFVDLGGEEDA
jgi:transcriptional regulator with XRE-family HTH domain